MAISAAAKSTASDTRAKSDQYNGLGHGTDRHHARAAVSPRGKVHVHSIGFGIATELRGDRLAQSTAQRCPVSAAQGWVRADQRHRSDAFALGLVASTRISPKHRTELGGYASRGCPRRDAIGFNALKLSYAHHDFARS